MGLVVFRWVSQTAPPPTSLLPPQSCTLVHHRTPHVPPIASPPLALADCQRLQVSCGHFSFIILSRSGTVLAKGDWVSVKHQELIEYVLKRVLAATLPMLS